MAEHGTITAKLKIDTTELDAKIAELKTLLAELGEATKKPAPVVNPVVERVHRQLAGATLSADDADILFNAIRARTR